MMRLTSNSTVNATSIFLEYFQSNSHSRVQPPELNAFRLAKVIFSCRRRDNILSFEMLLFPLEIWVLFTWSFSCLVSQHACSSFH